MTQKLWPTVTIQFSERPSPDLWELLTARLTTETDCLGIQEVFSTSRSAVLAPVPEGLEIYFPATGANAMEKDSSRRGIVDAIAGELLVPGTYTVEDRMMEDRDWGHGWREYFKTIRVGERLYVRPPWEQLPPEATASALSIQIDPGQAFGTGSHETTQLCLKILEKYIRPGDCLFDLGAGSGILGIGAILLGAAYCIGVECDPVCEENFLLNAQINGVRDRVMFILDDDPSHAVQTAIGRGAPPPDFVICNTLSEQFYDILPALRRIGKPMILSGFLLSESESVRSALKNQMFVVTHADTLDEWEAFVCEPV